MGLSIQREKFCHAYIETGNASEAHRVAYPKSANWAESAIYSAASRLLSDSKVSARIKELQKALTKKMDIKKEEVLKILQNIMYADIRDFLEIRNNNVYFKDSSTWTDKMAMQVESVKQTKDGVEIKLNGKAWSISRICKMLGFDEPIKTEVSVAKVVIGDE